MKKGKKKLLQKDKELLKWLKKGGRTGAKEDFEKVLVESAKHEPFDKKK